MTFILIVARHNEEADPEKSTLEWLKLTQSGHVPARLAQPNLEVSP